MISRTWHGLVLIEKKESFRAYLEVTGVKDAIELEGNKGVFVKTVDQGDYSHFFLCTIWEKKEDILAYAGDNPTIAITYPEDEKFGLISDPIVIHQDVINGENPFDIF